MKLYYLLPALFFYINVKSQITPTPKYFNKIGRVGKIITTNSDVTVMKADTVIVKIYILDKSKIYLTEYQQTKDSSGFYLTAMRFISPNELSSEFNLTFNFDNPITTGDLVCQPGLGSKLIMSPSVSSDRKAVQFRGTESCEFGIIAVFKSAEKISVTIKGIMGVSEN